MEIVGADNLTIEHLEAELAQGSRFVQYSVCFSIIILTFKVPTSIYYIRPGESRFGRGLLFAFCSGVMGWWGFPFGPILTVISLVQNLSGGWDVTDEVLASMQASYRQQEEQMAAWRRHEDEDPYASLD